MAYITGILPIARYNTQSALNNFSEYTMLNPGPFSQYYGFTENEVKTLCEKYKLDFETIKFWYDGYKVGEYELYNPNSIIELINHGTYKSYWSATAAYDIVKEAINLNFEGLKTISLSSAQEPQLEFMILKVLIPQRKIFQTKILSTFI